MTQVLDVVAAIIEDNGQILLARRPDTGDQPGSWEFPGGKVEANENQPQALARELLEELAISADIGEYIASHQCPVSGRVIALHAWHVKTFTGAPTPLYHSELRWCSLAQAQELANSHQLAPADIPLLDAFITKQMS